MSFTVSHFRNSLKHIAVCLSVVLGTCCVISAQLKERTIKWPPLHLRAMEIVAGSSMPSNINALEIVSVKVNGETITIGKPFAASDDWLGKTVFRIKNSSKKSIIGVRVEFALPETNSDKHPLGFSFEYGRGLTTGIPSDEQKIIAPEEEFE